MSNQFSVSDLSVGCVICTYIFDDQKQIVTTSCGHLYHENCLKKWLESARELNARKTCPDCRTNIHEKTDIKPVYAHLMSPDSSHKDELQRAKSDNDALRRQLFDVKSNLTVVKRQLTTEKARNTRLNTKLGKISKQMTEINGKDVSPKRAFKRIKANVASDDDDDHKVVTRNLRSRKYTYRL